MSPMDELERLDKDASGLLEKIAAGAGEDCALQFDVLLYEFVWRYLRANSGRIAERVGRYVGSDAAAGPPLLANELAEVAHDATTLALRRVREKAGRFDAAQGKATLWVLGAAEYAFVEVAKAIAAARRPTHYTFEDPQTFLEVPDSSPSTEEHILAKISNEQALEEAARALSEHEYAALRLVHTLKFSYAEAAEVIFGDAGMDRAIDGLLVRGRRKLAEAWQDRQPPTNAHGAGKVSGPSVDNTGESHV
jgi:DNA-directed RNA polymerase specialized sigma24 family protein